MTRAIRTKRCHWLATVASALLVSCDPEAAPDPHADAFATRLSPQFPPSYYVEQANKYFDTLDVDADPESVPDYSPLVARWELPPWLLLTGYGRENMIESTRAATRVDPSTVPTRDCRAFPVQPFVRCYVTFEYARGSCPIYEEFVFNDQGQMTFIEAWSDLPGLLPMPDPLDRWAEDLDVPRLSTKLPGLGNATGTIDTTSEAMQQAALEDAEIGDFVRRTDDFWTWWLQALQAADPDFFGIGCGWVP